MDPNAVRNSSEEEINNDLDLVDRIGALPDFILGDILSFLPTMEAVATSILSKRWQFMWMTVHNLDFSYDGCWEKQAKGEDLKFVRFVNRVLHLHDDGLLNNFRLEWKPRCISSYATSWINTAISRNVHELSLCLGGQFEVPISVFSCTTLRSLELEGLLYTSAAIAVCLPRLEILKLVSVSCRSKEALEKLIIGCPMLNNLHLQMENIKVPIGVFTCASLQSLELNGRTYISAAIAVFLPKLKILKLVSVCFRSEETLEKLIMGCPMLNTLHLQMEVFEVPTSVFTCASLQSLELNGRCYVSAAVAVCLPRLKCLKLVSVRLPSKETLEKLIKGCPMLDYLHLNICNGFTYTISSTSLRRLELFFRNAGSLTLEASSLEYLKLEGCISKISVPKSLSSLVEVEFRISLLEYELELSDAVFCNLIVEAVRACNCAQVVFLSADAMQVLSRGTINVVTSFKRLVKLEAGSYFCDLSLLRDFIQSSDNLEVVIINQLPKRRDHSKWTNPTQVPRCLMNNLKKVVFRGYCGNIEDHRKMIRYMLKHGSVLKVMQITCYRETKGSMFRRLQEICDYPRKSLECEVNFFGWTSNKMLRSFFIAPSVTRTFPLI